MTDLSAQLRAYIDAVAEPVPMSDVVPDAHTLSRPPRGGGRRRALVALVGVLVVAVIGGVLVARAGDDDANRRPGVSGALGATGAKVGQHWDTYLGIDVCGEWLPPAPAFEKAASDPNGAANVGIHSHGDGMIHVHPFVAAEADRHATVGKFFEYGGWRLSPSGIDLGGPTATHGQWAGPASDPSLTRWQEGDVCPSGPYQGQAMALTWSVDGIPQPGDPSAYHPRAGETIAVYLLPERAEQPFPTDACTALANASDFSARAPLSPGSPCRRTQSGTMTTRIVVPTRTMVAGADATAYVLVDNGTGRPVSFAGCGGPFQVLLANANVVPTVGWFMCRMTITIPTGETTYPVSVTTSSSTCSRDPAPGQQTCLAKGRPPPLPTGRYQATFFQTSESTLPVAPPVAVRIVGAGGCARPTRFGTTDAGNVVRVPTQRGSMWGLALGPGRIPPTVGDDLKIVWRVTGSGPFRVSLIDPSGQPRALTFGPDAHSASSFRKPGDEWGTGFHFDAPGCWRIRLARGGVKGSVRLTVSAPAAGQPER